jgi:hypothetical protein
MHSSRTSAAVLSKLLLVLCAAICSFALPAFAQYNSTVFGPNVYVFDPTVPGSVINSDIASISNPNVSSGQFSSSRAAVLFKPGTVDTEVFHRTPEV